VRQSDFIIACRSFTRHISHDDLSLENRIGSCFTSWSCLSDFVCSFDIEVIYLKSGFDHPIKDSIN
jgi:hypothetical protein